MPFAIFSTCPFSQFDILFLKGQKTGFKDL
jgi:hypothetical protein